MTEDGRLVLTIAGTQRDLTDLGISLREGLRLTFWCEDADAYGVRDDLVATGIVEFDPITEYWLARLESPGIQNQSEQQDASPPGSRS